ncbi:3'-5' exonuclease [Massilia sp. PWRC2]|uniref:3'-5' exonuclease n=1 Tax=Massilia sp. PWRC2 TaxID=2804626 RepID=UPI003CF21402
MFDRPIVMLDFETTGLSPLMGDRITEVAALRIVDGVITERYVSLVNCNARIPAFISNLTGITQAMVDGAPPAQRVLPELLDFIGSDTLSAHNASFDEKFLKAEAALLDLRSAHQALVCSLKLSRRLFPGLPSYKLGALSRQLGLVFRSAAHRAEADAEVGAQLLIHIARHLHGVVKVSPVESSLLMSVNRLAAAKVPAFLGNYATQQKPPG